jgi:hypothetical protein
VAPGWDAGRAAAAPAHITPDTQTPTASSAAAGARGTKFLLLAPFSRGELVPVLVTILNTIIPLPLDDIKQEYAQADRPANPRNTFQGTRPYKSLKSR